MRHPSLATILILALAALAGCSSERTADSGGEPAPAEAPADQTAVDTTNAVTTNAEGTRVRLYVTEDGFVPGRVQVQAGKPVTLAVTRTTDRTCATELVMKEHDINQTLPLNQTVEITFTPEKSGDLTYACGMDMIKGVIAVQ